MIATGGAVHVPVDVVGVFSVGAEVGGVDAQDHQLIGHVSPAIPLEGLTAGSLLGCLICVLYLAA